MDNYYLYGRNFCKALGKEREGTGRVRGREEGAVDEIVGEVNGGFSFRVIHYR